MIAERRHLLDRLVGPSTPSGLLARSLLIAFGLLFGLTSLITVIGNHQPFTNYQRDFMAVYILARVVADGGDLLLPLDVLAWRHLGIASTIFDHPSPHPPTLGIFLVPLAWLDYSRAAMAWMALEISGLGAAILLASRAVGARLPVWGLVILTVSALAWDPARANLLQGQVNLVILALLAGMWLAWQRQLPVLAGLLLGLSLLLKQLAWPMALLFVFRREWRGAAMAASVVLAGYLVAVWRFGSGAVIGYFRESLPQVAALYQGPANLSALLFLQDVAAALLAFFLPADQALPVTRGLAALIGGAVVLGALVVARRLSLDWAIGLMMCVMIVASPIAWSTYLVLALLPIARAFRWLSDHHYPARETNLVLLVVGSLLIPYPVWIAVTQLALGQAQLPPREEPLSFLTATLVLRIPVLSVGALAWLTVHLGQRVRG